MTAALQAEIIREVRRYLAGARSVVELEAWIRPATWNLHKLDDAATEALAGEVERYLAEFDRHHRTEAELRALLEGVLAASAGRR